MTETVPSGAVIQFESPPWLLDHAFTLREVSEVLGVPFASVYHWLHCLKWQGHDLSVKRRHRRLVTAHGFYALAIAAALHKQSIPVTPVLLRQIMTVTHRDGRPVLPTLGEQGWLAETDLDGTPFAKIEIELWAIWADLAPKLAALVADTASEKEIA